MKSTRNKQARTKSTKKSKSLISKIMSLTAKQWSGVALAVLLLGAAMWFGYSQQQVDANSSEKLRVMASFYPVYDLTRQVGGGRAIVENVTPAGAEAHDFEPSPKVLTAIHNSDLFIYHDANMEPWVAKFVKEYRGTSIQTIEGIQTHSIEDHGVAEAEDEHDHAHDPHVWTDPILAAEMVDNIAKGFIAADPANKSTYETNAAQLKKELAELDSQFKQGLGSCSQRTVVTSHSAFHYFADRYGLTIIPIAGLTPTQEPSAGKLAELSRLVSEQGIDTIFFESPANPHLAQTLAREVGAKTAILDPIEGINQAANEESYVTIQEKNLVNLKAALSCN